MAVRDWDGAHWRGEAHNSQSVMSSVLPCVTMPPAAATAAHSPPAQSLPLFLLSHSSPLLTPPDPSPPKTATHHCDWPGVTCDPATARVTKLLLPLSLTGARLQGGGLDGLVELQALEQFDFADNLLGGTLPAAFGALPRLSIVSAARNGLSGTLPPEWATGSGSIQQLWLDGNSFHVSIRIEGERGKGGLQGLAGWGADWRRRLDHSPPPRSTPTQNARPAPRQGGIPPEWAHPDNGAKWRLTHLICVGCGLNAPLPWQWSMPALWHVMLSGNPIPGSLYQVAAGSPLLGYLQAAGTAMQDYLGDSWGFDAMPQLTALDLSNNPGLQGHIPSSERRGRPECVRVRACLNAFLPEP